MFDGLENLGDYFSSGLCALAVVLVILVAVVVGLWWWRSQNRDVDPSEEETTTPETIRRSFKDAKQQLKTHDSKLKPQNLNTGSRPNLPIFLVLGPESVGKSTMLFGAGLDRKTHFNNPKYSDVIGNSPPCSWWYLSNGILLDVDGSLVLGKEGLDSDTRGWNALLDQLLRFRYTRPLDGVFLALSAQELLEPSADFEARAEQIQARLTDLTERLSMRLPVYLMITQSDRLHGYKEFCNRLPNDGKNTTAYKSEILGWSNPREIGEAFSDSWAQEAFNAINQRLEELQLLFFQEGSKDNGELFNNSDGLFHFPLSVLALRRSTQTYLSRVFGTAAFQQGPFLRGIYLCGDAGPTSKDLLQFEKAGDDQPPAEESTEPPPLSNWDVFFVKDLVHTKALPEFPLATPISAILQRRNAITNTLRVAILAALILSLLSLGNETQTFWSASDALQPKLAALDEHVQAPTSPDNGGDDDDTDKGQDKPRLTTCDDILQNPPEIDASTIEESASLLANAIEAQAQNPLRSALTPPSWFSSIDADIDHWLLTQYVLLLLDTTRDTLEYKACSVFNGSTASSTANINGKNPSEDEDEAFAKSPIDTANEGEETQENPAVDKPISSDSPLSELNTYITELALLETAIQTYQTLDSQGDSKALGRLVKSLFGADLNALLLSQTDAFLGAARHKNALMFTDKELQARARAQLNVTAGKAFETHFTQNEALGSLEALEMELKLLGSGQEDVTRENLDITKGVIEQTQTALARPQFAYLGQPTYTPDETITLLLEAIEASPLLGLAARKETEAKATDAFDDTRNKMRDFETPLTGNLLTQKDGQPSLALSKNVQTLNTALEVTLAQEFIPKDEKAGDAQDSEVVLSGFKDKPNKRIFWNISQLNTAVSLFQAYNSFVNEDLDSLPVSLQDAVFELAFMNLSDTLTQLVNQSASGNNTQEIPKGSTPADRKGPNFIETSNLAQVTGPLQQVAEAFQALNMVDDYPQLAEVIAGQTDRLLQDVEQMRRAAAPYRATTRNLSSWDGTGPLSGPLFGRPSDEELAAYLDLQRTSIRQLNDQLAQPLLALQSSPTFSPWLTDRQQKLHGQWALIGADIAAYDQATPGTPLVELEAFIGQKLNTITLDNCFEQTVLPGTSSPSDFFIDTRNNLLLAIQKQCFKIAEEQAKARYNALASSFSSTLQGQFPFTGNTSPPTLLTSAASPSLIRDFYTAFDADRASILATFERSTTRRKAGLSTSLPAENLDEATAFMHQLTTIRPFFAGFIGESPERQVPAYTLKVTFRDRTAYKSEENGNQIIDWSMSTDKAQIDLQSPAPTLTWTYGNPILLTLRWAKDSPYLPSQVLGSTTATIEDKHLVHYNFPSRWALIEMLQHSLSQPLAPCSEGGARSPKDPTPYTFEMAFKTAITPQFEDDKTRTADSTTTVFMRVEIASLGKDAALTVPCFPSEAPPL